MAYGHLRSCSMPGPVSTWMGDGVGVLQEIYLSLTNYPSQLSLAIPPWVGAMSTGKGGDALLLGNKDRYGSCLVADKTMWTFVKYASYLSTLEAMLGQLAAVQNCKSTFTLFHLHYMSGIETTKVLNKLSQTGVFLVLFRYWSMSYSSCTVCGLTLLGLDKQSFHSNQQSVTSLRNLPDRLVWSQSRCFHPLGHSPSTQSTTDISLLPFPVFAKYTTNTQAHYVILLFFSLLCLLHWNWSFVSSIWHRDRRHHLWCYVYSHIANGITLPINRNNRSGLCRRSSDKWAQRKNVVRNTVITVP